MKIKRFEQLYESISQDRIKEFYDRVKDIMDGWDKAMEEEPENEPSHSELSQEVGDVMNDMNLTTQDLKDIVDAYPNDMYIEYYVKPQLDFEEKELEKDKELEEFIRQTLGKHGVDVTDGAVIAVKEIIDEYKKEHF